MNWAKVLQLQLEHSLIGAPRRCAAPHLHNSASRLINTYIYLRAALSLLRNRNLTSSVNRIHLAVPRTADYQCPTNLKIFPHRAQVIQLALPSTPLTAVESARMANLSVPSPISTFVARPLLKCSLVQIPVNLAQNEEQKNTKKKEANTAKYILFISDVLNTRCLCGYILVPP